MVKHDIYIQGIPEEIPENIAAIYRSKILTSVEQLMDKTGMEHIKLHVGTSESFDTSLNITPGVSEDREHHDHELSVEDRAQRYHARQPLFKFDQLIVPEHVKEDLLLALDLIQLEALVFDEWGLRKIEPFPRTALNFYGRPGTGKTLAAHALASVIQRPILVASYAQIESMYHGEGPKNVEAIFLAAERENAVLFIDESDSLLSKRLTHVTQGSEQAINSMRSQLLICLEQFQGVVIFATNLVENYDAAFETRVRNIYFPMPDEKCRREIWKLFLIEKLPQAKDISLEQLAKIDDVCGRDIKNAVIDAAMRTARQKKRELDMDILVESVYRIKNARIKVEDSEEEELSLQERAELEKQLQEVFQ